MSKHDLYGIFLSYLGIESEACSGTPSHRFFSNNKTSLCIMRPIHYML